MPLLPTAATVIMLTLASEVQSGGSAIPSRRPAVGTAIEDFSCRDCLGVEHSLSGVGSRIVVLAFLGVDCPLARLYAVPLAQLSSNYKSQGVVFLGVDSNRQDGVSEISAFARRNDIPFPVLKDLKQVIADRVGATRTPEVVVLDHDRRIRYRGRIDDQFGFVAVNRARAYHKTHTDRRDLERALDELVSGKPVSNPETESAGCLIGRDRVPDGRSRVTYAKNVAPILNRHCVSCHRPGQIAPFSLTSYDESAGWADMIAEGTRTNRMPPWHADPKYGNFVNDTRLREEDKQLLVEWAAAGAPKGDLKDLPEPPRFDESWTIPAPDQVIYMPDTFDAPSTGVLDLQNFVVDPGWKQDRWIRAVEVRPGNPSVVHHILIFVLPPEGGMPDLRSDDCFLMAYAPGFRPAALPPGFARHVKAGSKLIFNVHYTPNGRPQQDRSYVGVKFIDVKAVRRETTICGALNRDFQIPPGVANYEVRSRYVFQRDSLLLTFTPHMHLRGKDFLYEAFYPDGRREVLLSVPGYDFDWQTMYQLAVPKLMPRGAVLECVAHFDNSEENPNNPDPAAKVKFGWQSFDEMMVGFFDAAPAEEGLSAPSSRMFAFAIPFSIEDMLVAALTMLNLSVAALFVWGAIRRRSRRFKA